MTRQSTSYVYLRLCRQVSIPLGSSIRLRDIAHILADSSVETQLMDMIMDVPMPQDGNLIVIDTLQVIATIKRHFPELQIEVIGEAQVLIEMVAKAKKPSVLLFIAVWLLLFFGAALTIMNFHADVNMRTVQIHIVEMITGEKDDHPYLFQLAYSIGLGLGMIVFFNHLFKKKWNEEPTPLEVEMFLYQQNLNQYAVAEEMKKKSEAVRIKEPSR